MERFVLLQALFNVVFLANILYLHQKHRQQGRLPGKVAVPKPASARRPLVLTLGLGPGPKAPPRRAPDEPAPREAFEEGLLGLVAATERVEAAAPRQRAAEDLRLSLSRLKERLEREGRLVSS